MQSVNLSQLLSPVTPNEFYRSYWPQMPLFIPGSSTKLRSLFELPELKDLESLLASRVLKVRACLPDYNDEYSSVLLEPEDAHKAYRNNMTLVFDGMQTQSAFINDTLKNIRSDLGLPSTWGGIEVTQSRAIAYATPAGGSTRLHFDANANFVVQIKGTKRWALAANTSVKNPTDRYTSKTGEIGAELEKQCHAQLLDEMPADALTFLMVPGCVLYVPRGYWHETITEEDSLSLNFTFSQPTWADIFAKALHAHLMESAQWRELADGLESAELQRKQKAIARFESLVKDVSQTLPNVSLKQWVLSQ